jgi:hypothetical protein
MRPAVSHHFIRENAVDTVMVKRRHPVETLDLIIPHLASLDNCHRWVVTR